MARNMVEFTSVDPDIMSFEQVDKKIIIYSS